MFRVMPKVQSQLDWNVTAHYRRVAATRCIPVCSDCKPGYLQRDCTPYSCEASRERQRGALLLFFPCSSRTRERLLLLLLILLAPSSRPTRFTQVRRAIVSVGTPVCNRSQAYPTLCSRNGRWVSLGRAERAVD